MQHLRAYAIIAAGYSLAFLINFTTGHFAEAIASLLGALCYTRAAGTLARPPAASRYHRKIIGASPAHRKSGRAA